MTAVKAILGFLVGAVIGFIVGFILFLAVCIIVGLATWNSGTGLAIGAPLLPLCILVGAVIGLVLPLKEEMDRQLAETRANCEARETRKRAKAEHRKALKSHLARLLRKSHKDHAGLPVLVLDAENHLDSAEQQFAERAFAPFWDEVERATHKLAAYRNGIAKINHRALTYQAEASTAPFTVVPFALPMHELPDARSTAQRLAVIVRKAQKDYQFASIFEQRQTNKILVAGFGTLTSAVYEMGDAISSSLGDLSNNVQMSLGELLKATREQTEQARAHAAQRRGFEGKVVDSQKRQEEMLDNLQRRRKPWP